MASFERVYVASATSGVAGAVYGYQRLLALTLEAAKSPFHGTALPVPAGSIPRGILSTRWLAERPRFNSHIFTSGLDSLITSVNYVMTAVSCFYVLSRVSMLACSIFLLANTYEVFFYRLTSLSIPKLVEKELEKADVRLTPDLIRLNIERVRFSNWLGHHVWPVPIWLVLAFLQTTSLIRRKWLWLHRVAGRAFLLLSLYMTLGYTMMFVAGEQILGEEQFYIDFRNPSKFFTFRAAVPAMTVWWFVSAIKAWGYAKRKLIALHKYWAWQFLVTGFAVGTMRIFVAFVLLLWYPGNGGRILDKQQQDVLVGYTIWLAFFVSTAIAHVVVGREIGLGSDAKKK